MFLIALRYRRYLGAWVIALGLALNLIPMLAHGGLMPVSYQVVHESNMFPEITPADIGHPVVHSKDIVLRNDEISMPWLADRFIVTLPGYGTNIYSLGDFVLFGGIALVVLQLVAAPFLPGTKSKPGSDATRDRSDAPSSDD